MWYQEKHAVCIRKVWLKGGALTIGRAIPCTKLQTQVRSAGLEFNSSTVEGSDHFHNTLVSVLIDRHFSFGAEVRDLKEVFHTHRSFISVLSPHKDKQLCTGTNENHAGHSQPWDSGRVIKHSVGSELVDHSWKVLIWFSSSDLFL